MRAVALAFLLGVVAVQQLDVLPQARWCYWLWLLVPLAILWRPVRWPVAVVAGGLWAIWAAHGVLGEQLAPQEEGRDLTLTGVVAALPSFKERSARFEFLLDTQSVRAFNGAVPSRLLLSWYDPPRTFRAAQRWQLTVRLKRPHGLMNPGGFDYEGWLFRHQLRATGYVREKGARRYLGTAEGYSWLAWRQRLQEEILHTTRENPLRGVLVALTVGEQRGITPVQWEVFDRTGTTHLVAISGSHITLIAGLMFFLARRAWARLGKLPLYYPAPQAAAWIALSCAIGYAALAGFAVPTQRAVLMIAVVMLGILWQRHRAMSHTLALALLAVLVWDPLAALEIGFWLSFMTVAVILWAMNNRTRARGVWRWGRVHLVVAVALLPVMLVLFQRVSLIAPLANALAVPWVELGVVPVLLLGVLLQQIATWLGAPLITLAGQLLTALWWILERASAVEWAQWWHSAPPAWAAAAGIVGVMVLIAPRGLPGRWLGGVLLLPSLTVIPPAPPAGSVWFTLLDVGQGLAAVVRTQNHTLLFDTGPRHSASFDTGSAVIAPFLRAQGVTVLDTLLLSHGDADHAGGIVSLVKHFPPRVLLTSVPERVPWADAQTCARGQTWQWDGVNFEILHPAAEMAGRGNDSSCVLRVSSGATDILLTGDIEKKAERTLLEELPSPSVEAEILVAPHHGSATSSTAEFVAAVQPRHVLFPIGYRNHYGFPKPVVAARYQALGAQSWATDRRGAVTFRIHPQRGILAAESYRALARRYWHD